MTGEVRLDPVQAGIEAIAAGRPVVVVDHEDRENEGDLVLAADAADPRRLGFMVRHTSGVVCVAMEAGRLAQLRLPPMVAVNEDRKQTAYTVSVDARRGVTTGISAADRATTIAALADARTTAEDLTRPGHVFPLAAVPGGVLRRQGHTEAAVDLARLAGRAPAGAIAELVDDDGSMMRLPALRTFADRHALPLISIAALVDHRRHRESLVDRVSDTVLPTDHGTFRALAYRERLTGVEHVALVRGEVSGGSDVLVRVHSECLTGDVFGSRRCDCGPQLTAAMARIAAAGRGVVVYMRGHEGRGIGIGHKLAAYALQDLGRDTVEANLELGLPGDARDFAAGAQILADLGIAGMRLLTGNPAKVAGLDGFGPVIVGREPLTVPPTPENLAYLRTKRDRLGHDLPGLDATAGQAPATTMEETTMGCLT